MRLDKLAVTAQEAFQNAMGVAGEADAAVIEPIHLLKALLDSDENTWNETLLEVPYDIDAAALEIRESGLLTRAGVWGHAILKQLYTGKNYSLFCVQRAEELAAGGPVLLEHWQQAARDFGILEG